MKENDKFKISTRPEDFFHIEIEQFQDRRIFPFQIYIYNPSSRQYTLFLHGNNPLINEKWQLLNFVLERGGSVAVRKDQQKTFLSSLKLKEDDVPALMRSKHISREVAELLKTQKLAKEALKDTSQGKTKFLLKEELHKSITQDDFSNLITAARNEIAAFSCTISPTVSLARYLALELLHEDNFYNRVVAFSYHLASGMGIVDQESLGSLICASFLYHLGNTQVDFSILKKPSAELYDDDRKKFRQHPGLTQHLLQKINLDLDARVYQVMLDHHERTDGSGFPNFKRGERIDPLALVLGASSHIFEYHYGLVTGQKTPLPSIFLNLKNKTQAAGLETEFGGHLHQNLVHLLNMELLKSNTPNQAKVA
ncbi:MAG TPA: hypothetical protein DCY86_06535 [Bdellovibrionales bacterium]|nr:hypothetical protein [Bdellovibrionales bacterium]